MTDDYKIYVDAGQPATLNNGAGVLTDCATLQEAVLAWQWLAPEQKIRATVKGLAVRSMQRKRSSGFITGQSRLDAPVASRRPGLSRR